MSDVSEKQRKLTTKEMLEEALTSLKSRKGVSLYAIKKYMNENFDFNITKMSHLIKKQLKAGIEDGTIAQVKGIGVSGSFKLVRAKKNPEKSKKKEDGAKETKMLTKTTDMPNTVKGKLKKTTSKEKMDAAGKESKTSKSKEKSVKIVQSKTAKLVKKSSKDENDLSIEEGGNLPKMTKSDKIKASDGKTIKNTKTSLKKTPAKKRAAMMKRKSIGSIIKTPKMKPSSK